MSTLTIELPDDLEERLRSFPTDEDKHAFVLLALYEKFV
jgi:predicted transcriptional regulator